MHAQPTAAEIQERQARKSQAARLAYAQELVPPGDVFDVKNVASIFKVSDTHVRKLIELGQSKDPNIKKDGLVAFDIAMPGAKAQRWRVYRDTLVRYLAERCNVS